MTKLEKLYSIMALPRMLSLSKEKILPALSSDEGAGIEESMFESAKDDVSRS